MTLSEREHVTKIRWGVTSLNGTQIIPELSEEVIVESEEDIECFDAIWARYAHIAIVDCISKGTFRQKNMFIFINTTSQTVIPHTLATEMFVGFTTITRRRFTTL